MEDREYLYMKKWGDYTIAIIYSFGAYYIARLCEKGDNGMAYTLRRYKTISGAERYMKEKVKPLEDSAKPELYFAKEDFIKKGSYWRL